MRLVIDTESGEVAQRLEFDEFGRTIADSNPGFQPFGYAGGLTDPDTGLIRFGARDYDPDERAASLRSGGEAGQRTGLSEAASPSLPGIRDNSTMPRRPLMALAAACAVLVVPADALGHGIGGADPNRPLGEYLWLGIRHLLEGWDHLLFILAIVLLAESLWQATKLISLFVAGHSITLMLATLEEWRVSAEAIDVLIALSVVLVAAVALRGRPRDMLVFGTVLFGIGLFHGLGLATRLLDLGVSDDDLVWRVLLFNVGVEIGQAIAVLAFAAAGALLARIWAGRERAHRPALVAILLAGAVGAAIISFPGESSGSRDVSDACEEGAVDPPPFNDAGHPPRKFYGPRERTPRAAFDHVLGDGFVVVTYRPSIAAADLERLRAEVEGSRQAIVAGPDPAQASPLVARTASRRIACSSVDVAAVMNFVSEL